VTPAFEFRRLRESEAALARPLFESYPYKQAQRLVQRLDPARLNQFYLSGLERSLASGQLILGAFREGQLAAIAGLSPDAWHSGIYGLKMAKISPWLGTKSQVEAARLLEEILKLAREEKYEHLSMRLDGEDYAALHAFEDAGFRLIDVSLKFSRAMTRESSSAPPKGWSLRLSAEADSSWMRELGANQHTHNHFLNDPHLPRERTHALWDAWVDRCIRGLAYRIYVAEQNGESGRGFVIYLRNRSFAETVGRNPIILDYIAIETSARGGGIGPWIVAESLARESASGFDYCELRTSQHNHAAIGLYEKLGFRICASDFILHCKL
jgi:GNAT superfamily N-acetyltransferase